MSERAVCLVVAGVGLAVGCCCWLQCKRLEDKRAALDAENAVLLRKLTQQQSEVPMRCTESRSWKGHLAGLDNMISELLCEARLLASELNKGGDPMAIVRDPLMPTMNAERNFQPSTDPGAASEKGLGAIREQLGQLKSGKIETKVVGVCGMSCSGKSTVSSVLRSYARECGSYVPVICLDDSYHAWMNDPPSRGQRTNFVPPGAGSGRAWKSWESKHCINWQDFLDKLQAKLEVHKGYTPFIIVEGFLLLENEQAAAMCDQVVVIKISKEVAWQRRVARALHMANGERDSSGMENYERLSVYAVAEDFASIRTDAALAVSRSGGPGVVFPGPGASGAHTAVDLSAAVGTYDWLWLYFEEVIWPEAEAVQRRVDQLRAAGRAVYIVDGNQAPAQVEAATRHVLAEVKAGV